MSSTESDPTPRKNRRWLRRLAIFLIALPVVLLAVRLWVVQGLWAPIIVQGDSMAPHLLGAHWQVTCDDCGCEFSVSRPGTAKGHWALCPNCGWRHNNLEYAAAEPGQRVLLGQLPRWVAPLARWQIVAVKTPGQAGRFSVKRLVGLPGERMGIRHGDLYVDGEILRKPLAQLRTMAVLVHADSHRPTLGELPARWSADDESSPWQQLAHGYACSAERAEPLAWLTYRHWSCQSPPGSRLAEVPPLDNYGYNQGVSRALNMASDLLLTAEVQATGNGRLALLAHDGREPWQAELVVQDGIARQVMLARGGAKVGEWKLEQSLTRPTQLEWAVCDRQVLLSLAGRVIFEHPYEPGEAPWAPTSRPLAIGTAGLQLEVQELAVWRDLVYLDPRGLPRAWEAEAPLAAEEYWLLGDNCPISRDSRNWPGSGVNAKDVLGPVWFSPVVGGASGR